MLTRQAKGGRVADVVVAEMAIEAYGRYLRAIEEARAAWDNLAVICGTTVQNGPRGVDRMPVPGVLPSSWLTAIAPRCRRVNGVPQGSDRSTRWEDPRR
jgi:hypothetical protein